MQDLLERVREFMGIYDDTTESRVPLSLWSTLLSGVLGLLLGLFIGWVLWPVQWENIRPTHLDPDSRSQYIASVADTYVASGETQAAKELAVRRLSGMNTLSDIGLAFKYFGGELVDDGYAQSAQPDGDARIFNLNRLSYALNIDPTVAINSVDMSGIAASDGTDVDSAGGSIDGQVSTDQSLDLLPNEEVDASAAANGGTSLGQMVRLGLTCLAALALILGGLYLLNYWWKNRTLSDDVDELNSSDNIGPYRDKPRRGAAGDATEEYDEDDEYHDDGDFDYEGEEEDLPDHYETDDAFQTSVDEINPYLPPPPAQHAPSEITQYEPEADDLRYRADDVASTIASTAAPNGPSASYQASSIGSTTPQPQMRQPLPPEAQPTERPRMAAEVISSASSVPAMRTAPADDAESAATAPISVGFGEVLTHFTARYQRGTQQYEQQRAIVATGEMQRGNLDGLNIGEYGMGVNIKNGILQSDAENVIALDVWLFDKTDQQGPRNQTRVLVSEYVIDNDLSDAIMRDDVAALQPIVPQKGEEFEIRGTTLRLMCKVIEAVYVNSGDMKGVFESVAVDMTVVHG